jgi:adenine deaminase
VLKAACINPVKHYSLHIGTLRVGDPADFIIVEDLTHFKVLQTYIDGQALLSTDLDSGSALTTPSAPSALNATTSRKKSLIKSVPATPINQFTCAPVNEIDLAVPIASYPNQDGLIPVIEALDGQLITNKLYLPATIINDCIVSNTADDILKMVVVNRYHMAPVAKSFIKNFGFRTGAIASTVAHDSHNIVAVGATDEAIAAAINAVIAAEGGVSCVDGNNETLVLPLPVAGLMSTEDGFVVAQKYTAIDAMAKGLGSPLSAPFMTLSFMALLVIPHLKLSDKGIFDGDRFSFL